MSIGVYVGFSNILDFNVSSTENDRDCCRVREGITGLDFVIGQVIPAALNSRVVAVLEAKNKPQRKNQRK